jgi:hypothetical protein
MPSILSLLGGIAMLGSAGAILSGETDIGIYSALVAIYCTIGERD